MNNTIHDQLNKLRIISKIKEGNSLTTSPQLEIYEFGYLNWFYRKLHQDNKDEVVKYLQEFYKGVDQSAEQLVGEITCKHNKKKTMILASSLAEKINMSIVGLEHLIKTYHKYPTTMSMIEGIVQDYALPTYKQLLDAIPMHSYTDILQKSIRFNGDTIYTGIEDKKYNDDHKHVNPSPPMNSHNNSPNLSPLNNSPIHKASNQMDEFKLTD